ncbi:MAG: 3-dehydroquinate synthase [Phycisphaerales bacterium]|nr:3-dehydroquinate synthase [Phycisphaerales bacterium]
MIGSLQSAGLATTIETITPSESVKTLETFGHLLGAIAGSSHGRVDPVVSLGGGIVCDIAGFVAASYRRGVPVIQCPSTLLAMVDASVGGKTGVNLTLDGGGLMKNLVGAFHQPRLVCADIALLESLSDRHRRSGLSECIKHAFICKSVGHDGLGDWMGEHLESIKAFDSATIEQLVMRNVALKATVVARDEHESPDAIEGGRMLLNFGHTFGHAIETLPGLSPDADGANAPLHHGEAVALGMVAACRCAESLGMCAPTTGDSLVAMLDSVGLPSCVAGLPTTDEIVERMGHDKKAIGSSIRLVLATGVGQCTIVDDASGDAMGVGIDSIRA